jgi:hypothetical protein
MFKVLKALKDTYITDKIIDGVRQEEGNLGDASSLDLFKLYGVTESGVDPNIELSRLLIKFDLEPLRTLVNDDKIDLSSATFNCRLKMFDVDGGQTVPTNFTLTAHPMSRSWDEGLGRDIVLYGDRDTCNFLSASTTSIWHLSGANSGGLAGTDVDYISTAVLNGLTTSVGVSQVFTQGTENLSMDITTLISATLSNDLPDEGFRIAYDASHETDSLTYFVKRFAARGAYDESFHPRLEVRFDDSIQDDSTDLVFDDDCTIFFYNFNKGQPTNLMSGTTEISGSDSVLLRMQTEVSGGMLNYTFLGSQHVVNGDDSLPVEGVYSASVNIPSSDPLIQAKIAQSGSVKFQQVWGTPDETYTYLSGSTLLVREPTRGGSSETPMRAIVNVLNVNDTHGTNEIVPLRVNIFDKNSPLITVVKIPVVLPGLVIRDVHYQVRDNISHEVIVPFDTTYNSTRVSSDSEGMYFKLDTSNLPKDKAYVVDILIVTNGASHVHKNASAVFRVSDIR